MLVINGCGLVIVIIIGKLTVNDPIYQNKWTIGFIHSVSGLVCHSGRHKMIQRQNE